MKQKLQILFLFIIVTQTLVAQKTVSFAQLKGSLSGFTSVVDVENFSDIQNMVPKSYNKTIQLNPDSTFSISIPITKPTYFRIGRNKVYLSPGDNMSVYLIYGSSEKAIFKGKGSEANNYLKYTPFPKGGSYLESGRNIKRTAIETLNFIMNKGKDRRNELFSLKNLSPEFIRLETARIRADLIKSIKSVKSYSDFTFRNESKEFRETFLNEFNTLSKPIVDSLFKGFVDPTLLQLEVYRDLFSELAINENINPNIKQIMSDWYKSSNLAFNQIKKIDDKAQISIFRKIVDSIKTKKYRDILYLLLTEKMKFGTGDVAEDIIVRNLDGTNTSLSSLKGKVIYIDIWATWCGPCLSEMPYLEALKKKFNGNNNIAIVSLSVDDNDQVWLKNLHERKPGGIQWRIDRSKLTKYEVETLPRYILIGKDFKIANMNASQASDKSTEQAIESLLNK